MTYNNTIEQLLDGMWLRTWNNHKFNYETFTEDNIDIRDIAHHLSLENRFCGACRFHYSVAYHSILGCGYVSDRAKLPFLLHDATEAYIKDIPRPLKNWLKYKGCDLIEKLEDKIFSIILNKYKIEWNDEIKQEVKYIDNLMYLNEKSQLQNTDFIVGNDHKLDFKIIELHPSYIERAFLHKFEELNDCRKN